MADWSDCRKNVEMQGNHVGRKLHAAGAPCPPRARPVLLFSRAGMLEAYRRGMRDGWIEAARHEVQPTTDASPLRA
jgi:hypothetical protein